MSLVWRIVAKSTDSARWWLARPLGLAADSFDRVLLRLYWRARDKADPLDDGIPF